MDAFDELVGQLGSSVASARARLEASPYFPLLVARGATILFRLSGQPPAFWRIDPSGHVKVVPATPDSQAELTVTGTLEAAGIAGSDPELVALLRRCLNPPSVGIPYKVLGIVLAIPILLLLVSGPYLFPRRPQFRDPTKDIMARAEVEGRMAEQLARPFPMRDPYGVELTRRIVSLGQYPEAPEINAELERRRERLRTWMQEHNSEVHQIHAELGREGKARPAGRQTDRDFENQVLSGVDMRSLQNSQVARLTLERCRPLGLNDQAALLPPEEQAKAREFALNWLREHPGVAETLVREDLR